MNDFVMTKGAEEAFQMAQTVMSGRRGMKIGQIIGEPGTGKTELTLWLEREFDAVRVECWHKMAEKTLMQEVAFGFDRIGKPIDTTGTSNTLFQRILKVAPGQLLILDEANHLTWRVLELVRGLSDIGGCGLIICGTDLLARRMNEARIRAYLAQLRQRIGAKRVTVEPITDEAELAAYVVNPRFGAVTKKTAQTFQRRSGGHWRPALELADACDRLMKAEGVETLNHDIVETAAAWMAGQS